MMGMKGRSRVLGKVWVGVYVSATFAVRCGLGVSGQLVKAIIA